MARLLKHVTKAVKEMADPHLLPYYVTCALYLVVYKQYVTMERDYLYGALVKAVPIWYLFGYVHRKRNGSRQFQNYFLCGLVFSSLGDVTLEFKRYFELGVLFFAVAQLLYLAAMKPDVNLRNSRYAWLAIPLNVMAYAVLLTGEINDELKVIVAFYSMLIHAMLYCAVARYENGPSKVTASSAMGAAMFVVSDFLIAYSQWCGHIPHAHEYIMVTYYSAQVLLALGVPN